MNDPEMQPKTDLEALDAPLVKQIPFYFFERHKNKTTKLLANSGKVESIEGRNVSYNYELKKPFFISYIEVDTSGYRDFDRFEFSFRTEDRKEVADFARPEGNKVRFDVGESCTGLTFTPPKAWFRTTRLNSVRIFGFKRSDTSGFIEFANTLSDLKIDALDEIQDSQQVAQSVIDQASIKQNKLNGLTSEISDAEIRISELQSEIVRLTSKLEEVIAKEGSATRQLEAIEERISSIRSEITVETKKREDTKSEVAAQETKLRDLKADVDLFPTEISGFARQSGTNIRWYLFYAAIPIAVVLSMFLSLIFGAADLTTVITSSDDINLAALIVSRIPYVLIASAIIYAAYRIARLFITEIMNINRQRLSLTKISIIAKDVSQAAENGLGLSGNEIYNLRLKAKMAMLGDHIKHLISSEPELLFPENIFPIKPLLSDVEHEDASKEDGIELDDENSGKD